MATPDYSGLLRTTPDYSRLLRTPDGYSGWLLRTILDGYAGHRGSQYPPQGPVRPWGNYLQDFLSPLCRFCIQYAVEKLLQCLVAETQSHPSPAVSPPEWVGLEKMLRSFLSGQQQTRPPHRQRPIRRDSNGNVCFSCGKSGHAATRCPTLDESFLFMMLGWRAEKTLG